MGVLVTRWFLVTRLIDPLITSNQGVSSNQPYNSQFIKETPR